MRTAAVKARAAGTKSTSAKPAAAKSSAAKASAAKTAAAKAAAAKTTAAKAAAKTTAAKTSAAKTAAAKAAAAKAAAAKTAKEAEAAAQPDAAAGPDQDATGPRTPARTPNKRTAAKRAAPRKSRSGASRAVAAESAASVVEAVAPPAPREDVQSPADASVPANPVAETSPADAAPPSSAPEGSPASTAGEEALEADVAQAAPSEGESEISSEPAPPTEDASGAAGPDDPADPPVVQAADEPATTEAAAPAADPVGDVVSVDASSDSDSSESATVSADEESATAISDEEPPTAPSDGTSVSGGSDALATAAAADEAFADVESPTSADALRVRGLIKDFGDQRAVNAIDLTVPAGSFYGIVGPNGAGKTTTLSIIAGLLRADGGTVHVSGIDQKADPLGAKRVMGVLPDRLRTFDRLTGRQLLHYYGLLRGLDSDVIEKRSADLARAFDLTGALSRVVSDYSAGMTKKIMLAGAMIHSPRVLVLDEPFEAVDPVSSGVILDILRAYVAHGGTVILSSHGMDLVERVCSRVAIIVGGDVLAEGTIDDVRAGQTLESRFVELAGSTSEVEGLEWLHTFSD